MAVVLNLLAFARSNRRLLAILGAVAAVLSAVAWFGTWQFHRGAEAVRAQDRAAVAKLEPKVQAKTAELHDAATDAGAKAQIAQDRIVYRTQTIIERIPADVPPGSVADVRLGAGWVRNYAAGLGLPEDPRLAGLPADQPYISAADALGGLDRNSSVCLAYRDAYERVVSLYDQVRREVNGFKP